LCAALIIFFSSGQSHADTQRVVDYQYDNAGNIVRAITQEQSAAPVITLLDPGFTNIGRTVAFTALGNNLLNVAVTTAAAGLSVSNVISTVDQVTFQITASNLALTGVASLDFTNGIGTTSTTISVAEPPPSLTISPNPVAIANSASPTNVTLTFTEPRPTNETYAVTIGDTGIATTASNSFTILAGETQANLSLTGITNGATNLDIVLASKFYFYSFSVFVGKTFEEMLVEFSDMLTRNLFTNSVGVLVQPVGQPFSDAAFSQPVGIFVNDPTLPNPSVFSLPVSVFVDDATTLNPSSLSQPVGVNFGDIDNLFYSLQVEVIYGSLADTVVPTDTTVGVTTDFEVSGFNLSEVLSVSVTPDTDITIGTFITNTDGTIITIPLTIDATAALGLREIVLQDASGVISTRSGPLTFEIK